MARRRHMLWACLAVTVGLGSLAQALGGDGESILKAREAALAARDADAVMALFADDAVVGTSSGRAEGTQAEAAPAPPPSRRPRSASETSRAVVARGGMARLLQRAGPARQ